jgi:hypothetical protein
MVMAWSVGRLKPAGFGRLSLRIAGAQDRPIPAPTGPRHDDIAGKALFKMMGVFTKFERAMIAERVRAGLARARGEGKRLGRPIDCPDTGKTNPRGAGGSWAARCARHCQTVRSRSLDSAAHQPPFRRRKRRRRTHHSRGDLRTSAPRGLSPGRSRIGNLCSLARRSSCSPTRPDGPAIAADGYPLVRRSSMLLATSSQTAAKSRSSCLPKTFSVFSASCRYIDASCRR